MERMSLNSVSYSSKMSLQYYCGEVWPGDANDYRESHADFHAFWKKRLSNVNQYAESNADVSLHSDRVILTVTNSRADIDTFLQSGVDHYRVPYWR